MKVKGYTRKTKEVVYRIERKGEQANEEVKVTCKEAPLAELDEAMEAFGKVIQGWMDAGSKWKDTVHPVAVDVSYRKDDTRTVRFQFHRKFAVNEQEESYWTPWVQIDDSDEDRKDCTAAEERQVNALLGLVEAYINGDRQQQLLPLDAPEGNAIDDEDTATITFPDEVAN